MHEKIQRHGIADVVARERAPAQRHTTHAEEVINQHALAHRNGQWRDNAKIQPRRRQGVEVGGISEEMKQFLRRQGQSEFGLEFVNAHPAAFVSFPRFRPQHHLVATQKRRRPWRIKIAIHRR